MRSVLARIRWASTRTDYSPFDVALLLLTLHSRSKDLVDADLKAPGVLLMPTARLTATFQCMEATNRQANNRQTARQHARLARVFAFRTIFRCADEPSFSMGGLNEQRSILLPRMNGSIRSLVCPSHVVRPQGQSLSSSVNHHSSFSILLYAPPGPPICVHLVSFVATRFGFVRLWKTSSRRHFQSFPLHTHIRHL